MSQTSTRLCPRCRFPLQTNQRFCTNCGLTLDAFPGVSGADQPGSGNILPTPPLSFGGGQAPQPPQLAANQSVPSVQGTPSIPQHVPPHALPGQPQPGQPGQFGQAGQVAQSASLHGLPAHGQPSLPQQFPPHSLPGQSMQPPSFPAQGAQASLAHGTPALPQQSHLPPAQNLQGHAPPMQSASLAGSQASHAQPAAFHAAASAQPQAQSAAFHAAASAPPAPPQAPPTPGAPHLPGPQAIPAAPVARGAGSLAKRTTRAGLHLIMKKPLISALVAVVIIGGGSGFAYYSYQSTAPSSFVIATDRGHNEIDRIDLATRSVTILLSNKVLPTTDSPDSIIFLNSTQVLIDFISTGEIGIGDIQQHTYKSLGAGHGSGLRDMALRPDGSSVLISDTGGNILEYHLDTQKITTFAQNLGGVQGLAFDSNGNLFAAVGGQVIQLDPATSKQLKTYTLPGGSDGMAYDGRHHTLDVVIPPTIVSLDPVTSKVTTLINGISTPDGLAIDRQGNLFIAADIGVLELNTNNQLLIVGTNSNGIAWDDVAPLSGTGAASY